MTSLLYYLVAIPVLTVVDVLFLGFKVRGWEYLQDVEETGAVIACNHIHYLDCSFLAILTMPRRPVFCTLEQNFQIPVVKYLIKWLGGVAIPRKIGALRRFMNDAAEAAQKGKLVIIYPEGELKLYCDHLRPLRTVPSKRQCKQAYRCCPAVSPWKSLREFSVYSSKSPGFMNDAAEAAQKGKLVIIYPEGELKLYCDHLRPFKDGAFKTAVQASVPVLPCCITQENPQGIFRLFKQKPCLVLNVGEPVYPRKILTEETGTQDVRAMVRNLRDRVYCEMERLADREIPSPHGEPELDSECPEVV